MVRRIAPVVVKGKIGEEPSDVVYWRSRSIEERLESLYELRRDFHGWPDGTGERLQRVFRIIRQK